MDGPDDPCTVCEQLWAEALARYYRGERANLPRELYALQDEVNLAATARPDELQNEVAGLDTSKRFTYREVAKELKLVPTRRGGTEDYSQLSRQTKYIRQAMTAAGWVHKRVRRDGRLLYCWLHPANSPESGKQDLSE